MLPLRLCQTHGSTHTHFIPSDSGLQPKGLHPTRGVARSGFRPLPKILDCSHPKVSGQNLRPSRGGRALTPPRHRRLGEPLPHRLANTTQAAPRAESHLCLPAFNPGRVIRYYLRFPIAIPDLGARRLRLTTPFAAFPPCGVLARLACLIHAANVHSEPGSNPSIMFA